MSYFPWIAGGAALGLAARGRRASRKFDYRDYVDLTTKKISLKEFLQRNPEIKLADSQRLSAFPGSGLSKGYSYDCFVHAELRAVELSGAPSFRQVDWEGVGISGAGSDPRKGTDIPWSQAKKGDWVRWAGLGGHYGVVIDPQRKIVESCWGYQGAVFQHPVDFHPYPGTPKVYPIRLKGGRRAAPTPRFQLATNCIASAGIYGDRAGDLIRKMVETSRLITYQTMSRRTELLTVSHELGYDRYFPIKNDPHVGYYKGVFLGEPVYFFKWSGIEYIFTADGNCP